MSWNNSGATERQSAETRVRHMSAAGLTVDFAVDTSVDLSAPFTSFVDFELGGNYHAFGSGNPSYGSVVAREVAETPLTESYRYQGGTLRLGTAPDVDSLIHRPVGELHTAVWVGRFGSVYTRIFNGRRSDLIHLLDHFAIDEDESGVSLRPLDGARISNAPRLYKEIPDHGLLITTPLDVHAAGELPNHAGHSCHGGELFLKDGKDGQLQAVIVNPTSATTFLPNSQDGLGEALDRVSQIRTSWSAS